MTRQRQSYAQFLAIVATCAAKPRSIALEPHCVRAVASTDGSEQGTIQIGGTLSCNTRSPSARALSPRLRYRDTPWRNPPRHLFIPVPAIPIAGLPPHEIVTIVRSTGLEPLGSPVRQGPAYALRAVDPAGEEVRVIVDAQRGRIVKVIPLMAPRYAMPLMRPPYGRPPRPIAMVPEGYGPYPRAMVPPPGAEGPCRRSAGSGNTPGAGAAADPAASAAAVAATAAQACRIRFIGCQARNGSSAAIEHETTGHGQRAADAGGSIDRGIEQDGLCQTPSR